MAVQHIDPTLKELLDFHAARVNSPEFVQKRPCSVSASFYVATRYRDSVAALFYNSVGQQENDMCRLCENAGAYGQCPVPVCYGTGLLTTFRNIRIFTGPFLPTIWLTFARPICNLQQIRYMADFALDCGVREAEFPSWHLAEAVNRQLYMANGECSDSRCLPLNMGQTALKRLNMALRWLVRDDGIVDLGVWKGVIEPSRLFVPLDVHVGNTARALGLLQRKAADRKSAVELTGVLRALRPHDPVWYDYALFGIGVEGVLR